MSKDSSNKSFLETQLPPFFSNVASLFSSFAACHVTPNTRIWLVENFYQQNSSEYLWAFWLADENFLFTFRIALTWQEHSQKTLTLAEFLNLLNLFMAKWFEIIPKWRRKLSRFWRVTPRCVLTFLGWGFELGHETC